MLEPSTGFLIMSIYIAMVKTWDKIKDVFIIPQGI